MDRPIRLRPARPASSSPARNSGIVPEAGRILGLDDGQPADRPGRGGDADADGRRLHGDRRRRHPQAAAADQAGRRRNGPRAEGAPRDQPRTCAAQVREMLEGVLAAGGTASEVSVPGYTLAGKTGTAQVAENGGYSETKYVASFIGFAPAQDPKLLAAVIVDQPQGEIYGGSVAAPAFGKIAAFALPYLGVPRNRGRPGARARRGRPLTVEGSRSRVPQAPGGPAADEAGLSCRGSCGSPDRRGRLGGGRRRSPTTAERSGRGRCSSACPGRRWMGMSSRGQVVEAGAAALVVERELEVDGAAGGGRRRAGGDGAVGGARSGATRRRSCGSSG